MCITAILELEIKTKLDKPPTTLHTCDHSPQLLLIQLIQKPVLHRELPGAQRRRIHRWLVVNLKAAGQAAAGKRRIQRQIDGQADRLIAIRLLATADDRVRVRLRHVVLHTAAELLDDARLALHLAVLARVRAKVRQIALVGEHALSLCRRYRFDLHRGVRKARIDHHPRLLAGGDAEAVVGDLGRLGGIVQQHPKALAVRRRTVVVRHGGVQHNNQAHVAAGAGCRPRIQAAGACEFAGIAIRPAVLWRPVAGHEVAVVVYRVEFVGGAVQFWLLIDIVISRTFSVKTIQDTAIHSLVLLIQEHRMHTVEGTAQSVVGQHRVEQLHAAFFVRRKATEQQHLRAWLRYL